MVYSYGVALTLYSNFFVTIVFASLFLTVFSKLCEMFTKPSLDTAYLEGSERERKAGSWRCVY